MKSVRLDLSPMFVNRTAAFNLCADIHAIATEEPRLTHDLQFFGHQHDAIPKYGLGRRYVREFFEALGSGSLSRLDADSLWGHETGAAEDAPATVTFYIDPLYVLFGQLRPDDIVVLLDLSPITHPQWHNPAVSAAYLAALRRILAVRPRLAAISQNTIDTLEANFGSYGRPISHLPLYPPGYIRDRVEGDIAPLPVTWPYFLFVGSLESRKNMAAAITAFRLSGLVAQGYRLLLVGGRGHGADEIAAQAIATEGVVLSGYLSQDDLCAAYQGATGFIYPSYLEGFGVPLLEAMSFGIPAIASFTGACPEVGGDDVVFVDPDDHAEMARRMVEISSMSSSCRAELGARLRLRTRQMFSYDMFRSKLVTLLCA